MSPLRFPPKASSRGRSHFQRLAQTLSAEPWAGALQAGPWEFSAVVPLLGSAFMGLRVHEFTGAGARAQGTDYSASSTNTFVFSVAGL